MVFNSKKAFEYLSRLNPKANPDMIKSLCDDMAGQPLERIRIWDIDRDMPVVDAVHGKTGKIYEQTPETIKNCFTE